VGDLGEKPRIRLTRSKPCEERATGPVLGHAGITVADRRGEEFEEAPRARRRRRFAAGTATSPETDPIDCGRVMVASSFMGPTCNITSFSGAGAPQRTVRGVWQQDPSGDSLPCEGSMPQSVHPLIDARHDQMFPVLEPAEVDRLARFGERKSYAAGERIVATGEVPAGAFVILSGVVDVMQGGRLQPIVTHGPGSFMGELAQLSGRPSLVDAYAREAVEVLVIPSRNLRDLLVEEAELGERIMRALILRRVALLDMGAGGPVIVGSADHADVVRLEGFLAQRPSAPAARPEDRSERADADRALPYRPSRFANRRLPQRRGAAQPGRG
jgi:CRP-like cAMP-binding protein